MLGEYWIDKQENGDRNSFFKMLDNQSLNADETAILNFMKVAQHRYENIKLPPEPRLDVSSLEKHFPNASENVLEALTKCCVLTYVFVPIRDFFSEKYKSSLSYMQRYALWKGAGFKGVKAYADDFIKESIYAQKPICENLFKLHKEMDIKDFSLKKLYDETIMDVLKNPQKVSLWNSKDETAISFRQAVFEAYPELKILPQRSPMIVSRSALPVNLNDFQQKTL